MTCHTEIIQCLDTYQVGTVSGEEKQTMYSNSTVMVARIKSRRLQPLRAEVPRKTWYKAPSVPPSSLPSPFLLPLSSLYFLTLPATSPEIS